MDPGLNVLCLCFCLGIYRSCNLRGDSKREKGSLKAGLGREKIESNRINICEEEEGGGGSMRRRMDKARVREEEENKQNIRCSEDVMVNPLPCIVI